MESLITAHWAVMGEADPRGTGPKSWWTSGDPGTRAGTEPFAEAMIGQQNTMRDAVLAGLTSGHIQPSRGQDRDG